MFDVRLDLPEQVTAGTPVRIRLVVRNAADRPSVLMLGGGEMAMDAAVARVGDGPPVWTSRRGLTVPMVLEMRPLGPGEEITFEAIWDQSDSEGAPVPAGDYLVRASLTTDGADLHAPLRRVGIEADAPPGAPPRGAPG
jgi:hypothetical protein